MLFRSSIDGIINNGRKDEPVEGRRSVLDALKAFSGTEQPERKPPQKQAERDGR